MTHDTMINLAKGTGGRAYYNTNGIAKAIREAIEDSKVTYLLGYYPTHGKWDGSWRKIKVNVKLKGVRVRYRSGYNAFQDKPPTEDQMRADLLAAAWSPLESTGLGVTVRVTPLTVDGVEKLKLEVRLEGRELNLEEVEGKWQGAVNVLYVTQDEKGTQLASDGTQTTMNLKPETYAMVMREGVKFNREIPMKPGGTKVRVVVRDARTGAMGTVTVPVEKYFPRVTK
jgi:hypothetical protein